MNLIKEVLRVEWSLQSNRTYLWKHVLDNFDRRTLKFQYRIVNLAAFVYSAGQKYSYTFENE